LLVASCQFFSLASGKSNYFTSLCGVCFRQRGQNFFSSIRSGVVFRFFVFE
jgi:hypothetical protein